MTSTSLTPPATRERVEAHISALDDMLDWAEKHQLTLDNLHATWFLHGCEDPLPLLLDGAEPGTVREVEGGTHYLVRDFGASVSVIVPLPSEVMPGRSVTVLNPAITEQDGQPS